MVPHKPYMNEPEAAHVLTLVYFRKIVRLGHSRRNKEKLILHLNIKAIATGATESVIFFTL